MDVNGGFSPNPNGSPVLPGTTVSGPLLAGSIIHSDGSGTFAQVGETNGGTANVGYVLMAQTATGVTQSATAITNAIVIPAQSQLTGIQIAVTTASSGTTAALWGAFQLGAAGTSLTPSQSVATGTTGILFNIGPAGGCSSTASATSQTTGVWDNIGNQDQPLVLIHNQNGNGVFTITAFYLQAINNAS